jgi:predicted PurR-regulated permease PerM
VTPDPSPQSSSPAWQPSTRLAVGLFLMLVVLAAVLLLRQLLIPVLLAALLTYLLHPIVLALSRRMRRGLA